MNTQSHTGTADGFKHFSVLNSYYCTGRRSQSVSNCLL